jgi:protein arginine kinase
MDLERHLASPAGAWMSGRGPDDDVVVSSRVRLARNVEHLPFPNRMDAEAASGVLALAERALGMLRPGWEFYRLGPLPATDRRLLVEKHLISPLLARTADRGALMLREDEAASVMVNEEDHFRIQSMTPGRDLARAWEQASAIDDRLEADLDYAFDESLGYLTACPTNVGTGLRASAMVHLPALVMTGRAAQVLEAVGKLGLAVRGLYGEGTEAVGNLFQISNQKTLGPNEMDIVRQLDRVAEQIVRAERESREAMLRQGRELVADRIGRAEGILRKAHILNTAEAMRLLSDLRLGIATGMVEDVSYRTVNELLVICRSGFLGHAAGRELVPPERDVWRAKLVRERLAGEFRS